jgi:hypothetical protein
MTAGWKLALRLDQPDSLCDLVGEPAYRKPLQENEHEIVERIICEKRPVHIHRAEYRGGKHYRHYSGREIDHKHDVFEPLHSEQRGAAGADKSDNSKIDDSQDQAKAICKKGPNKFLHLMYLRQVLFSLHCKQVLLFPKNIPCIPFIPVKYIPVIS